MNSDQPDRSAWARAALEQYEGPLLRFAARITGNLELAYDMAKEHFKKDGINRIIVSTDGDFNQGVESRADLVDLIQQRAKTGVFLTVLGFGEGNLQDDKLEALANKGNGSYHYIDSFNEARRVLLQDLAGTLVTIAKDVKLQLEFNPAAVGAYRLIGYENRVLAAHEFDDDRKDAGEIGAGHTVTALYELVPAGVTGTMPGAERLKYQTPEPAPTSTGDVAELLTLYLRYKRPDAETSQLIESVVQDVYVGGRLERAATPDQQFASAVAGFGMLLRDSIYKGAMDYSMILSLAEAGKGADSDGYRAEFINLVKAAQAIAAR